MVPSPRDDGDRDTAFVPAWWLPGSHLQTAGARWSRPLRGVRLRRERLTTPDGDFLDLDWAESAMPAGGPRALVLLLHGLEGSARSGYALETYRRLARRGIPAVGLNFRSCSGPLNRGPRLYHSGETEDTRFVIRTLRARFPDARLGLVGFSLGGNVLVKYLGEEGERGQRGQGVAAAAAISVPYDLAAGARYMERGLAQLSRCACSDPSSARSARGPPHWATAWTCRGPSARAPSTSSTTRQPRRSTGSGTQRA
jgi:predicted alpha/beta-fold hydrolase